MASGRPQRASDLPKSGTRIAPEAQISPVPGLLPTNYTSVLNIPITAGNLHLPPFPVQLSSAAGSADLSVGHEMEILSVSGPVLQAHPGGILQGIRQSPGQVVLQNCVEDTWFSLPPLYQKQKERLQLAANQRSARTHSRQQAEPQIHAALRCLCLEFKKLAVSG